MRFRALLVTLFAGLAGACGGTSDPTTDSPTEPTTDGGMPPPLRANAVADAGPDLIVSRSERVRLDGTRSVDPDGDPLTYTWTQISGAPVVTGPLEGALASLEAPDHVTSFEMELIVDDGNGPGTADRVLIVVLEDANAAVFVDGTTEQSGDGTIERPFATIREALDKAPMLSDVYVRTLPNEAAYNEVSEPLTLRSGTSLYGGFGADWQRDEVGNKTRLDGATTTLSLADIAERTTVSGFDIRAADGLAADADIRAIELRSGLGLVVIEDSVIAAGHVGEGTAARPGTSYGVWASGSGTIELVRTEVTSGAGGNGAIGDDGEKGNDGAFGATGGDGGAGGRGRGGHDGGNGGNQGSGGLCELGRPGGDGKGPEGGTRGVGSSRCGYNGGGGQPGGPGDPGTPGAPGAPTFDNSGFAPGTGESGATGTAGSGGGGGGGGAQRGFIDGGHGGGGGEGGAGGRPGFGGAGGGASIGLGLFGDLTAVVIDSTITSTHAGSGASGGVGGPAGRGGSGGTGAPGRCDRTGCGGRGGHGGSGGNGGVGGPGGAGAGGLSAAIAIGANVRATVRSNVLESGRGGRGGDGRTRGDGGRGGDSFGIFIVEGTQSVELTDNTYRFAQPGAPGSAGDDGSPGALGNSGPNNINSGR